LIGSGYFPQVQVSITCSPASATFTASYSGAWATFNQNSGSYLTAQLDKVNFSKLPDVTQSDVAEQTPFGSSAGTLSFQYGAPLPATAGSIGVSCAYNALSQQTTILNVITLNRVLTPQTFVIPDTTCPFLTVLYVPGSSDAGSVSAETVFFAPGRGAQFGNLGYIYAHITTNTTTTLKTGAGLLHTVLINTTGTAETVTIFDATSCAGTVKIGAILVTAANNTFLYDVQFQNGLCITTAGTTPGDYTITWQ
jgi:hypothetical protein